MDIVIRVDAHEKIALGHLRRCISLADGLLKAGQTPIFITYNDPDSILALKNTDFAYHIIQDKVNCNNDLDETCEILKFNKINTIIVDSYDIDSDYITTLRKYVKTIAYLDDVYLNLDVDIIINGAFDAFNFSYLAPTKLLGHEYILLSEDYWSKEINASNVVNNVLVTMGGIDHYDLSSRVLPILEKIKPGLTVNIVVGPYYENLENIMNVSESLNLNVVIHKNLNGLYNLIKKCELAISAGGFTLYELAAMGVPTVGICLWENQRANVTGLGDSDALLPVYYSEDESFESELSKNISLIFSDSLKRESIAKNSRSLIDGAGAIRTGLKISDEINKG